MIKNPRSESSSTLNSMEKNSKLYYSDEIVEEILSRLPPKSLMRFQCVCTMWCTLIKSPSFVAKHLSSSKRASRTPILFKRPILRDKDNTTKDEKEVENDDDDREMILSSLNIYDENDDDSLLSSMVVEDINVMLPAPLKPKHSWDLVIAGHYDGIICLKLFIGNVILCNPAMKEFKLLPKSFLLLPNDDDKFLIYEVDLYTDHVGFGYDPKGEEYKVVRFVIYNESYYRFSAEVYTMKSNSWREIKTPEYGDIIDDKIMTTVYCSSESEPIYMNGICYWNVYGYCHRLHTDNGGSKDFILSFDMENELFHEISIPDLPDECCVVKLALWKGFVSFFTCQRIEDPQSYDMWVMMDDIGDGKGSWRKHLTIGNVESGIRPLQFWKSDQLLMVNEKDGHIVSYNIRTQKYLRIEYSILRDVFYIQPLPNVNSMVSIDGGSVLEDIHISAFYGSKLYTRRREVVET